MKKQNEAFEEKQARLEKTRKRQNDQSSEKREQRLAKKRKNTNARRQLIRDVESPLDKQVTFEV